MVYFACSYFLCRAFSTDQSEDILYNGKYSECHSDVAFMIPIAEMAESMSAVEDILYIYNRASSLNDDRGARR